MLNPRAPILLVDDSEDTLELYTVGLSFGGHRVVTATTINAALQQVRHERPGVIVTDIQLGRGESGWDLIRAVRHDPPVSATPVVVLTGRQEPALATTAAQLSCAALLVKPCLPDTLRKVLQPYYSPEVGEMPHAMPDRRARPRIHALGETPRSALVAMIEGTYRETPGLSLDLREAVRFFGIRERTCAVVFEGLVEQGRLRRDRVGRYAGGP
jgi:CheY-like chemotaxis protein